jgi:hypothetical protein
MTFDPYFRRSSRAVLVLLLVLTAAPAAAMTVHEAKCRAQLSDSYEDVITAARRAVALCHRRRDKGALPASTNCNLPVVADSATRGDIADAEAKFLKTLEAHCKDVPAVLAQFVRCPSAGRLVDDGGPTTGIDSFEELAQCLSVQLNDVFGRAAEKALGLPDLPLDRDARKCHSAIARDLGVVIQKTFRHRSECQRAIDEGGGPVSLACATDPYGIVADIVSSFSSRIESRCATSAAMVDSCATTGSGIAECAMRELAARTAGGLSAMAWELKGTCPGAMRLRFDYDVHANDVDTGWSGFNHDSVPIGDYDAAQYALACDEDCINCTGASPSVPADHCRCDGDASVQCGDDTDCAEVGGTCTCYFAPPTHVSSIAPYCTMTPITSPMAGSADLAAGTVSLDVEIRQRIGYGGGHITICPVCVSGLCDGGARDGLACTPDAVDPSFGDTSFDCPPQPGANLTGQGVAVRLSLSTEALSLPFHLPCDAPLSDLSCACSTCSLDNRIACNSDAECEDLGAGVCRTDGLHDGDARRPNSCSDHVCTSDPLDPGDGICANDPEDLFCDGFVQANGRGVLTCATDSDCESLAPLCPGGLNGDCGSCSVAQPRECFLGPIEAAPSEGTMAGGGCIPPTLKSTLDQAYGIPGPYRIQQAFSFHGPMCSDGVTPFEEPGGSNCP